MPENTSDNPYASPDVNYQLEVLASKRLTFLRCLGLTTCSAALFGFLGCILGSSIAFINPGYYQTIFGIQGQFVLFGGTLGLTQGVGTGVVVGLILCGFLAWYWSRVRYLCDQIER